MLMPIVLETTERNFACKALDKNAFSVPEEKSSAVVRCRRPHIDDIPMAEGYHFEQGKADVDARFGRQFQESP